MKTVHFESIGGASGDMILGALIALGVPVNGLNEALKSLQVDPFEIVAEPVVVQGMSGLRARVVLHDHHHHDHDHHHGHHHDHHHGRHLSTILGLIEKSALPEAVKCQATTVFRRIGEAEAAIHQVDIEKIHFHEVGAMDSIVDIVGCCLALQLLGVDQVVFRALPQGHGTIECAHGVYPNPAPATLRLLEGLPVALVDEPFELVTPTGAALLSEWRTGEEIPVGSRLIKSAYSFGQRTLKGRPNLLRATLYESSEAVESEAEQDEILVLECNLDDSTPELVGLLFEPLFAAGALDVYTVPALMKKQRPGILLTILCNLESRAVLLDLLFKESSTFGVREYRAKRTILARRIEQVETPYGSIAVKVGIRRGRIVTVSPEMGHCEKVAREQGVAIQWVYQAALAAAGTMYS
jgi:pyridinium-3,5-bisthiocarboxylic acid mononucleotide nickel chelatase